MACAGPGSSIAGYRRRCGQVRCNRFLPACLPQIGKSQAQDSRLARLHGLLTDIGPRSTGSAPPCPPYGNAGGRMRSAPWHVKGIDPGAGYTAGEASRRSGVSVGQWLNSVILEQAADEGIGFGSDEAAALRYGGGGPARINARLGDLRGTLCPLAE